jgi:hypothetical protein
MHIKVRKLRTISSFEHTNSLRVPPTSWPPLFFALSSSPELTVRFRETKRTPLLVYAARDDVDVRSPPAVARCDAATPKRPFVVHVAGALFWAISAAVMFGASRWLVTRSWGFGRERAVVVALLGILAFATRWPWRPIVLVSRRRSAQLWLVTATLMMLSAFAWDVRVGVESITHAVETGEVRLDQGQNLFRSAQLLSRGENPYGRGALIDLDAFAARLLLRARLGIPPRVPPSALIDTMERYERNPDPALERQLLPEPAASSLEVSRDAEREYSILGHKYGPLPLLVTLPLVGSGPVVIPILQLAVFVGWIAALFWCLRSPALRLAPVAIPITLTLILLEPHVAHDYLYFSASDSWCLAFSTLALGSHLRNYRALVGLFLALALSCKLFPAALFVPLVFARPMRPAILSGAIALAVLYCPFLLWDARGLWLNIVAWPLLRDADTTCWLAYFPSAASFTRAALLPFLAWISMADLFGARLHSGYPYVRRVAVDPARFAAHFALASAVVIFAGKAFHNNYVPWVTSWGFAALALAFASAPIGRTFAPLSSHENPK